MIYKRPSSHDSKVVVVFEIPGTIWAESVNLVGDFNNWDRESLPFRYNRLGNWQVEVELDAGKEYRFRYLLDGDQLRDDWQADKSVQNLLGGYDSFIVAEVPPLS